MKIISHYTNACLWESEHATMRETLVAAVTKVADLQGANLRGADLQGANLREANLRVAYLWEANLRVADLQGANLQGAYLRGAYLRGAYLRGANLREADLQGADLRGADLRGADLQGADLQGADLRGADLQGANLQGANLREANGGELAVAMTRILPAGAIVGWKKCRIAVVVKLSIPEDAPRSHAFGRKCRAAFADVLEVIGAEVGLSQYDGVTEYRVGQRVTADRWEPDWTVECGGGIHFFITREEAEAY